MIIDTTNSFDIVTKEIIVSKNLKRKIKKLSKISGIRTKYLIYFLIFSAINEYVNLKNDDEITSSNELEKLNGVKQLEKDFVNFYSGVHKNMRKPKEILNKEFNNSGKNSDDLLTTLRFIIPRYVSSSLNELKKCLNDNIHFKNQCSYEMSKKFKITNDYLYAFLISKELKAYEKYTLPKFTGRKENDSENPIYRLSITDTLAESYKLLEKNTGISSHEWMKYILFEYLLKRNFFNNYVEYDISK